VADTLMDAQAVANMPLHRSGYVPSQQDIRAIRHAANDLPLLEDMINQEMRKLSNLKLAIWKQKALHNALAAPWRRLPPEILSMIFVMALPNSWSRLPACKRTFNCMAVCVMWRNVALQTPQLWTSLRFDRFTNTLKSHVRSLATELRKSGQLPLDLSIDLVFTPSMDAWSDEAWALLCAESHRWRRSSLEKLPAVAYERLSGRVFPALQALSIGHREASLADLFLGVFNRQSCQLTSLSITYATHIHRLNLPASWPLTELELDLMSDDLAEWTAVRGILVAYSATLRVCTISSDLPDFKLTFGDAPIKLPCLEELTLVYEAIQLGQVLECANLQSPVFAASGFSADDAVRDLKSFLDMSSGCKRLRSLTLRQLIRAPLDSLVDCLDRLPSLTDLELKNFEDCLVHEQLLSLDLLCQLARDDTRPGSLTRLPNLERLSLIFEDTLDDEDESEYVLAIKNIAYSRQRPRMVGGTRLAPLKYLHTYDGMIKKLPNFERRGEKMRVLWPPTSVPWGCSIGYMN
ncbi:hypothetical protein EV122DRAFT_221006, partial [Schizophyllum commune]